VCLYIYIYIYRERERERERERARFDLMDRGVEDGGRQESEGRLADVNTTLFPFIYLFLVSSALP
jgi:hypothetical protein